jgi:hypothetical protein
MDNTARVAFLREQATAYARLALDNIGRDYPAHVTYVAAAPGPPPIPRDLHPAFYGSFDWHSCVAMHWTLARLLRRLPGEVPTAAIREALDAHLTAEALAAEAAFFAAPGHRAFQFPYGWGWALALADELGGWDDPDARRWAAHLAPLAEGFAARLIEWLPLLTYPVRSGVHANTAFGLLLALPYAERRANAGDPALRDAIAINAHRWFANDADYPAAWEPSGSDFLSPALTEAALLARLLPSAAFTDWLGRFLPDLADERPASLFTPATVSVATAAHIGHLHGLNLSRAWAFGQIGAALPGADPRRAALADANARHTAAALPHIVGGDYLLEHWLVNFAVLLLS